MLLRGNDWDEFRGKVLEFEKVWNVFVRELWGCEMTGEPTVDTCREGRAKVDYKAFARLRKMAKGLFELGEK